MWTEISCILEYMLSRYTHDGITWIDLSLPTREEVRQVMEEFSIDPLVAEELLLPTIKPRIEIHPGFIYLILHFPALRHSHGNEKEQEVDFVVGKDFIVTTRYDTIDPLHKFSKIFEVNSVLEKSALGEHAGYLLFFMLKKLYKSVEHELSYVHDALEDIEEQIFEGRERQMVEALSRSGRDLLNLRQAIEPHRDVLKEFLERAPGFFGDDFAPYVRATLNEYYRVHNHIMRHTESLHELRETNNSLVSTKQNEVMLVLTLTAFVTFPLSLMASLFGMGAIHTPIIGQPFDFWIILTIMGFASLAMFGYFHYKKWL